MLLNVKYIYIWASTETIRLAAKILLNVSFQASVLVINKILKMRKPVFFFYQMLHFVADLIIFFA